tara:strand:+ start:807 stop:1850 length:1044 start_codon:yes stop_codon:yes gene_type:complete
MSQTGAEFDEAWNPANKDSAQMNKSLGSTERFQINQALEKRGGLRFNYAPTLDWKMTKRVWIPFFENPLITETRKANYASNKVFLRNEPVRLYTGSEARKFKVEIHYSLIHMAAMLGTQDVTDIFAVHTGRNTDQVYSDTLAIATYLKDTLEADTGSTAEAESDAFLTRKARDRGNSTEGPWGPNRWWKDSEGSRAGSNYWNFALMWLMRTTPHWIKHHQVIQKVINNVRSSVIATAQLPVKGPPIVELKWGTMYNFTPCIVTDYKIQPIENAGYDTKSLTAQRLKISFSLEEMRNINGNLWGNPEIGGDLPGWDTIQDLGYIDPKHKALTSSPITPGSTWTDRGGN